MYATCGLASRSEQSKNRLDVKYTDAFWAPGLQQERSLGSKLSIVVLTRGEPMEVVSERPDRANV